MEKREVRKLNGIFSNSVFSRFSSHEIVIFDINSKYKIYLNDFDYYELLSHEAITSKEEFWNIVVLSALYKIPKIKSTMLLMIFLQWEIKTTINKGSCAENLA